ncbi:MAG: DsbA family protein [Proteobacteria bacterium]|nr:DsbA family protein [Pseudomonadota bacterium]
MNHVVDIFLDFRSPYSYLATPEIPAISENFNVATQLRFGLPLAIRKSDFFRPDNIQAAIYISLDWERRAEMLGLPHAWPSPDPIVQSFETFEIADEQPYIHRLTYLGIEAERRGRGIEFATPVFKLIFGGTKDWHLGDHLKNVAKGCGLDFDSMEKAIADTESYDGEIEENHRALADAGHWGVPTFVFNGEPFFGQDRIETLCWRLEKEGLAR